MINNIFKLNHIKEKLYYSNNQKNINYTKKVTR